MIRIDVVTCERSGYIIAVDTDLMPTAHVVGQLYRDSPDGSPERWKAWLWPKATAYPQRGQSTEAVTAATPEKIAERLRGQLKAKGPWWSA